MDVIHGANPLETLVLEDAELRKLYPGKILCQSPVSMPEWGETRGVGSTSWDRLFEATKRIAAQYSPSTVLLVTHGDAIGACIYGVAGYTVWRSDFCCYAHLERSEVVDLKTEQNGTDRREVLELKSQQEVTGIAWLED
jgi:broad specificity phosphatase PhoE